MWTVWSVSISVNSPDRLASFCSSSNTSSSLLQEDRCLFWTDRASSRCPSSASSSSPSSRHRYASPPSSPSYFSQLPLPSTPRSFRPPLSSSPSSPPLSLTSPSSLVSKSTPCPPDRRAGWDFKPALTAPLSSDRESHSPCLFQQEVVEEEAASADGHAKQEVSSEGDVTDSGSSGYINV